jgi:dTDP-4-dehydrorhamnose reductase
MLGSDVAAVLRARGAVVVESDRDTLDISDADAVSSAIADAVVVINCAAYTAVDAAETEEDLALVVNGIGPGVLARECAKTSARLIHISTDYVFSGEAHQPYSENAPLDPRSAYGRTKAEGEREVIAAQADALIVRTAALYGARGECFPRTIAQAGREKGSLRVVDDQITQPTWSMDLADLILRLIESDSPAGVYHGTSSGQTSWFGFATEVVASAGLGNIVAPCAAVDYPRPAARPAYSVLAHDTLVAAGVEPIGNWLDRWHLAAPMVLAGLT